MVFSATFNNISAISWWLTLLVGATGVHGENHRSAQVTDKLYHILLYLTLYIIYKIKVMFLSNW
jgi:hypothetical protein